MVASRMLQEHEGFKKMFSGSERKRQKGITYAGARLAQRAAYVRRRGLLAMSILSSGSERSDISLLTPQPRARLARRAAYVRRRGLLAMSILSSGLERSDIKKRAPETRRSCR